MKTEYNADAEGDAWRRNGKGHMRAYILGWRKGGGLYGIIVRKFVQSLGDWEGGSGIRLTSSDLEIKAHEGVS